MAVILDEAPSSIFDELLGSIYDEAGAPNTRVDARRSMAFQAHSPVTAQATMGCVSGQPVQAGLTTLATDPWISMYPG